MAKPKLVVDNTKKKARKKAADEWRSVAKSWRIKDGRHVIVWLNTERGGISGEAYYHRETKSWWWANTAPGEGVSESIEDQAGYAPCLWHPMPSNPPKKDHKSAISAGSRKTTKKQAA